MKKKDFRSFSALFALIVASLSYTETTLAQSLKEKYVTLSYQAYPKSPLPSYVKSYAIVVKGFYEKDEIVRKKITNAVDLKNFAKVSDATSADAVIELNIQELNVKKKEEKKEVVDATVTNYRYEVTYVLPTTLVIFNKDKTALLRNEKLFETETTVATGTLGVGGLALASYYSDNSIEFICLENSFEILKNKLADDYSFTRAEFTMDLYTAKGKKISYDDLDNAASQTKDALKKTSITGEPAAEQKAMLESAIAKWQSALTSADTVNANARINKQIFKGIHFNLAVANAWMGRFGKAWAHYKQANTPNPDNISAFGKWFVDYENRWMMNHVDQFSEVLIGTWRVSAITSRHKVDLNKDGTSSNNVLEEYEACKKDQVYEFGPAKKLSITIGGEESCKKVESIFWTIAKNSKEEKNYILWDTDSASLGFSNAGAVFKFIEIGHNQVTIKGDALIDRGSDTSDEISITFTRL